MENQTLFGRRFSSMLTRILTLTLLGAFAFTAAADDKSSAANADRAKFQGTWKFITMEQDGQQMPKDDQMQTITFEGDKFTVKAGDMVIQAGTQKLDATKKPKQVDATVTEGQHK